MLADRVIQGAPFIVQHSSFIISSRLVIVALGCVGSFPSPARLPIIVATGIAEKAFQPECPLDCSYDSLEHGKIA